MFPVLDPILGITPVPFGGVRDTCECIGIFRLGPTNLNIHVRSLTWPLLTRPCQKSGRQEPRSAQSRCRMLDVSLLRGSVRSPCESFFWRSSPERHRDPRSFTEESLLHGTHCLSLAQHD